MTLEPRRPPLDSETCRAFNEMLAMHQLSLLSEGSLVRVLQSIPQPLLAWAWALSRGEALRSPCRDEAGCGDRSPPPGFQ